MPGVLPALIAPSAAAPARSRGWRSSTGVALVLACVLCAGDLALPTAGGEAKRRAVKSAPEAQSTLDLDEVAELRSILGVEDWGEAQLVAYNRMADGLVALRDADQATWDGPDGAVYAALAELQLWLFKGDRERSEAPYKYAVRAIGRIERMHGDSAMFQTLLATCARYAVSQGRTAEAQALLTEERVRRGVAAGRIETAWAYLVLIDLELDRGRYGAASDLLDEALDVIEQGEGLEHLHISAEVHVRLVQLETERGRIDWARAALDNQRKATQRLGSSDQALHRGRADWRARQLLVSELRIDNARQDAPTARARSRRLFDETGKRWRFEEKEEDEDLLDWTLRVQAVRAVIATDPDLGLALAEDVAESERAGAVDRAFCRLLCAHAAVDQGDFAAAERALDSAEAVLTDASIGEEHVIRARLIAERARTARARAAARAAADPGGVTPDLEADLRRLRSALEQFRHTWLDASDEPDGVGFLQFDGRRELLVEVHLLARAAQGEKHAAELLVEELAATQALGGLTRALDSARFDLAAATELLRARNEGLVMLFPGRSELLLVALDGEGPLVLDLGPPAEALAPLQRLAAELRRPDLGSDAWRELARDAGARLFHGALRARALGWSRWSFVQPELVGSLPLEVLDVEGLGVLGLERPTAILPTLGAWLALEARADLPRAQRGLVALVEPLPDAARTAELGARADLGGTAPRACEDPTAVALSGAGATLAALADAARGAEVLLLWSHGHESSRPGEGVGFEVSAPGGAVGAIARARDVEAAFAATKAPPLVVLGICGALRPESRPGEDASAHLGGTFLALGANVVLASVRDVHAASARTLVDTLLARRAEGATDSDALLAARRAVASGGRFGHPHYWASLSAVGVAHRARD